MLCASVRSPGDDLLWFSDRIRSRKGFALCIGFRVAILAVQHSETTYTAQLWARFRERVRIGFRVKDMSLCLGLGLDRLLADGTVPCSGSRDVGLENWSWSRDRSRPLF